MVATIWTGKGEGDGKVHLLCMLILLSTMETLVLGWAAIETKS